MKVRRKKKTAQYYDGLSSYQTKLSFSKQLCKKKPAENWAVYRSVKVYVFT
jgi:hypothetical protein